VFPQPVIVGVLGSAAVLCVVLGLWLPAVQGERSIARRLRSFVEAPIGALEANLKVGRQPTARGTGAAVRRSAVIRFLERRLAEAESHLTTTELLIACGVLAALMSIAAYLLLKEIWLALPGALVGAAIPLKWLGWRRGRKVSRFTRQLPDAIGLLASSVRSGHSLPQALEHVATDAGEPTKSAFLLVGREIGLGASQEDALERLATRYPSDDLQLVVASINVQHQIGGSLAKVLDSISETIRERLRIEGDIKALTAPQRVSAYVLCGLPVFVTLGLLLIGPDYIGPLFEPGPLRFALIGAITLVTLGFLVMRQMTKIDV
jgi:tight adherence protein B